MITNPPLCEAHNVYFPKNFNYRTTNPSEIHEGNVTIIFLMGRLYCSGFDGSSEIKVGPYRIAGRVPNVLRDVLDYSRRISAPTEAVYCLTSLYFAVVKATKRFSKLANLIPEVAVVVVERPRP